ncbi:GroES-like protein [Coniophora puteana RWD-64-598 SS2]|uniref:GroES-like protein n=1 Tax=Coniophora puteana (strain RWD-64-598) TaxID=741705 RepID=A0A5M3MQB5_CONPW|nr:GroES-like protein [Coniophora puteana RWD-64-598 SS2]EIW80731.1 GroES-like protein [Coniophora puteana RWD-64-598 SS2]
MSSSITIPSTQVALHLSDETPTSPRTFNLSSSTPVPRPAPGHVLVRNEAAGLNPLDAHIQEQGYWRVTVYPAILGWEGAGVVVEVGESVKGFQVGDRVAYQGTADDTRRSFQQYSAPLATATLKIPKNISFDEGATIPTAYLTVIVGLYQAAPRGLGLVAPWAEGGKGLGAHKGRSILIMGGSSQIGLAAIQLARLGGFHPILTTASLKHEPLLTSLGATQILDRSLSTSELVSQIKSLTQLTPLALAYDSISTADTQLVAFDALAPSGGDLVLVLPPLLDEAKVKAEEASGKKVTYFMVGGSIDLPADDHDFGEAFCKAAEGMLERGDIKPGNPEIVAGGLNAVWPALQRLKAGQASASKFVVRPSETVVA